MTTATLSTTAKGGYMTYTSCRLCGQPKLKTVLNLGNLFLSNFMLPDDPDPPRAPLVLTRCESCGMVQLRHAVDPDLLYRHFWYQSGVNDTMRAALADVITDVLSYYPGRGTWIDIGANDGTLFNTVPKDFHKIGVDPCKNIEIKGADEAIHDYFSAITPPAQVITSIAMFYDLNDPHQFVDNVRKSLAPDGVWVNQLSYTPEMVRQLAFDNICHEHVCYYTLTTLKALYAMHGLDIVDASLNDINGGSIRVVAKHLSPKGAAFSANVAGILANEGKLTPQVWEDFAKRVMDWKRTTREVLHDLRMKGKSIHLYGASTKGNTLLQYLDYDGAFDCVADRNPVKWGRLLVGSWLGIVSEEQSRKARPDYYFVLPWAFKDEFVKREVDFFKGGGKMIFPLPKVDIVG